MKELSRIYSSLRKEDILSTSKNIYADRWLGTAARFNDNLLKLNFHFNVDLIFLMYRKATENNNDDKVAYKGLKS